MTFFKTLSIGPAPGIEPKRPPALQSNFFLPTELILTQFILVLCSQWRSSLAIALFAVDTNKTVTLDI